MQKRIPLTLLLLFSFFYTKGQKVITKGYIIDENNEKVNCWIINRDWNSNPGEFEYKLTEGGSFQKGIIPHIKEFGSPGVFRYIRKNVDVDISSNDIENLSENREPIYENRQVFLKVLVDGSNSLYSYIDGPIRRFFFENNDKEIQPLIYKQYILKDKNLVITNSFFRQQLFFYVNKNNKPMDKFKFILYNSHDLVKYFETENKLSELPGIKYTPASNRDLFNLSIRPGINYSTFELKDLYPIINPLFPKSHTVFRLGLESEFIFPFFNSNWSFIFEPTYQSYSSKSEFTLKRSYASAEINYQSIEYSMGLRYTYKLKNASKLFLDATLLNDAPFRNSKIYFSNNKGVVVESKKLDNSMQTSFGVGFKTKQRLHFEVKYHTPRDIVGYNFFWDSKFKTVSLIAGFDLI